MQICSQSFITTCFSIRNDADTAAVGQISLVAPRCLRVVHPDGGENAIVRHCRFMGSQPQHGHGATSWWCPPSRSKSTATDPGFPRCSQPVLALWAPDSAIRGRKDHMRRPKSSNPQTLEGIISMIEDVVASCCCAPAERGAASHGTPCARCGAGHASSKGDCALERPGGPSNATTMSGAGMRRHTAGGRWSDETAPTPEIEAARGFTKTVSRLLGLLRRTGTLPEAGLTVAIDTHLIPRRGPEPEPETPCQWRQDMDPFEQYVTVQCVDAGPRLFLGALPFSTSGPIAGTVSNLIRACRGEGIRIRMVLLDRGLFTAGVAAALDSLSVDYLAPCSNTPGMAKTLSGFAAGRREKVTRNSMDDTDDITVRHTMIIEPPAESGKERAGFATNVPGIDVDEYYSKWGVETGHAVVEGVMDKMRGTTGPGLPCFLRSLMVFNGWAMIDTLQPHRLRVDQVGHPRRAHRTPRLQLLPAMHPVYSGPSGRS